MFIKILRIIIVMLSYNAKFKCKESSLQNVRSFPEEFMFGTATASYQVEGGWDADGKSENIWDHFIHNEALKIADFSNGDIADDSYHHYKRDVEMMRELGLDHYRFSLSWTRILPNSFPNYINQAGVQYYNNLIDEMLKYNIQPMVTLYHWDLPQKLQNVGGWANPYIADWFADYARVAFKLFGDRVKYWITINEPSGVCTVGESEDPKLSTEGIADYMCAKNLLLAHAKVYHIYDKEFRPKQGGIISITISAHFYEPDSVNDNMAAQDSLSFEWGQYADPIFSDTGDFPQVMKERIAAKSAAQGFPRSRLPEFTPDEVEFVKGSYDFFGLNHYTTFLVYRNDSVVGRYKSPSYYDDLGVLFYQPSDWEHAASNWLKVVPRGLYNVLTKIREDYNNPPVYITENGFSTHGGLNDDDRVSYCRRYLNAMLNAIDEGSNVRAYTVWSLMDNFEWTRGYKERFGLYEVDFTSPNRTRTPRKSAFVYKEIVRSRKLDFNYEPPQTTIMTIDAGH